MFTAYFLISEFQEKIMTHILQKSRNEINDNIV